MEDTMIVEIDVMKLMGVTPALSGKPDCLIIKVGMTRFQLSKLILKSLETFSLQDLNELLEGDNLKLIEPHP